MKLFIYLLIFVNIIGFTKTTIAKSSNKTYRGYVILQNSEKVYGNIEMLSPVLNQIKVKLKPINTSNTKVLRSNEVQEYFFQIEIWNHNTRQYTTKWIKYVNRKVSRAAIPFGNKKTLLLQETAGTINYFNYFYQSNSDIDNPVKNIFYVEKSNHNRGLILLNKKNYKEILQNMTYNFVELHAKIGTSQYGFKHVKKIIAEYNAYMEDFGEEDVFTNAN